MGIKATLPTHSHAPLSLHSHCPLSPHSHGPLSPHSHGPAVVPLLCPASPHPPPCGEKGIQSPLSTQGGILPLLITFPPTTSIRASPPYTCVPGPLPPHIHLSGHLSSGTSHGFPRFHSRPRPRDTLPHTPQPQPQPPEPVTTQPAVVSRPRLRHRPPVEPARPDRAHERPPRPHDEDMVRRRRRPDADGAA